MIKNKEKIIKDKAEKINKKVKTYVDELDRISGTDEFNIDTIEEKWSELDEYTKQIYKEINDEIIEQINEKEIIKVKKKNMKKKG